MLYRWLETNIEKNIIVRSLVPLSRHPTIDSGDSIEDKILGDNVDMHGHPNRIERFRIV